MGEWQPLDTAPRDGSAFLAYSEHSRKGYIARQDMAILHWTGDHRHAQLQISSGHEVSPHEWTHWMPLPSPPTAGENR